MIRVERTIALEASRATVWAVLSDLGAVADYSPGVSKSWWLGDQRQGVGAARHCDIAAGGYAKERVTIWDPERGYTLHAYEGLPRMMKDLHVHFRLADLGGGTQVVQIMEVSLSARVIEWVLGWAIRGQLSKAIEANLDGLRVNLPAERPSVLVGIASAK